MEYDLKLIGSRIRDLRKGLGFTQEKMAKEVGVSLKHWGAFERGGSGMCIANLMKISDYFDVTVDYIIYGDKSTRSIAFANKYGARLEKLDKQQYNQFTDIVDVLLKGMEK